jgi:hypothetical protein
MLNDISAGRGRAVGFCIETQIEQQTFLVLRVGTVLFCFKTPVGGRHLVPPVGARGEKSPVQSSKLLLTLASTVVLGIRPRRDP